MQDRLDGVGSAVGSTEASPEPLIIRKYLNRRLYNTMTAQYVTLADIRALVQAGVDLIVRDVPTGADITRQVLGQVILEAEGRGEALMPDAFLRHLIALHGDGMGAFVPSYLQHALDAFCVQKDRFASALPFTNVLEGEAAKVVQQQVRQNLMVFDRAIRMFGLPGIESAPAASSSSADLAELYVRMAEMQGTLDRLVAQNELSRTPA